MNQCERSDHVDINYISGPKFHANDADIMALELVSHFNIPFSQMMFLVGAFSLKEKSPTLTVSSFFLVGAFSLKEKSPTLTVSSFFFFFS